MEIFDTGRKVLNRYLVFRIRLRRRTEERKGRKTEGRKGLMMIVRSGGR